MRFAKTLRAAREAAELSVGELAKRMGCAHQWVTQIEKSASPTLTTLHKVAKALGARLTITFEF